MGTHLKCLTASYGDVIHALHPSKIKIKMENDVRKLSFIGIAFNVVNKRA